MRQPLVVRRVVRDLHQRAHPLRQFEHPYGPRRVPRCQQLAPPLHPRAVRLEPGQRHRPGPGHIEPGQRLGRLPQHVGQLPFRLAERRHVGRRGLPHRQAVPQHLGQHVTGRPGLHDLRHQAETGAGTHHRFPRLHRRGVEVGGAAQPQRMAGRGQRDAQSGHAQGPQPAERERQPDYARFIRQTGDAVDRIVAHGPGSRVIR